MSSAHACAPCLLCGEVKRDLAVVGYDRLFPRVEDYPYLRCAGCGLVALDRVPSPDALATLYPQAYFDQRESTRRNLDKRINRLAIRYYYGVESRDRSRLARALFSLFSSRILSGLMRPWRGNRLLDVGCGTGALIEIYRRLGWTVYGIDSSAAAVAAARARDLPVHLGDVFDAPFDHDFDVVLLSHCIEHVREPAAVLRRAATFLAAGGKLVILTPNARSLGFRLYGSCWYGLDAPRHLLLFDCKTLPFLARAAGLAVTKMRTRAEPTFLGHSRNCLRTQGRVLPDGLAAREALLRASTAHPQRHRLHRELVTPIAWIAARRGRGEVLEAELCAALEIGAAPR